ncbi:hypothetical protein KR49_08755 [Synechococcus sp. KORDI-49]|nr:hypothetical protein KR49_08755 [Synechococcus sp. KORDI-49]
METSQIFSINLNAISVTIIFDGLTIISMQAPFHERSAIFIMASEHSMVNKPWFKFTRQPLKI